MLERFGFSPSMPIAERAARFTITVSLIFMMIAPLPLIFCFGAGPFALFYPLLILLGFRTLKGKSARFNSFYLFFALLCGALVMASNPIVLCLLPILLFGFMLYFQAERRLYYLIELQKEYPDIDDSVLDMKRFCRMYLAACCRNAILPTLAGCVIAVALACAGGMAAWPVSLAWLAVLAIWHSATARKA